MLPMLEKDGEKEMAWDIIRFINGGVATNWEALQALWPKHGIRITYEFVYTIEQIYVCDGPSNH